MDRKILHIDCNKFYASVECSLHPEWRDIPLAVGGSEHSRHGIILTKNDIAARYGLVTGEPLWSARQKCPELTVVPPHFSTYIHYSDMVRDIMGDYSDLIEPFGLDEAWLDVTGDGDAAAIADEIRRRVWAELGITVSIGVSFTKTFAKLGSDYRKPDAVTVFSRENYREKVWPLSLDSLLFVGRATKEKLQNRYFRTIGDIAQADPALLRSLLGKAGGMLYAMANGLDHRPVLPLSKAAAVQSVSNGMTTPRDLTNEREVKILLFVLAESVGRRLREQHLAGKTIELHLRENDLHTTSHRVTLNFYLQSTEDIARETLTLFRGVYGWRRPLRSVTLAVTGLEPDTIPRQTDMTGSDRREKRESLDHAVDMLKSRFGSQCIRRAVLLEDPVLSHIDPYDIHTVHPVGFSGKMEM